jgi:hypothetical protein
MSKMGISTYMSYCGAQIFEAIGLRRRWSTSTSAAPPPRSAASACSRSPRRPCACTGGLRRRPGAGATCSTPAASTPGASRGEEHMWTPDASPSCSTAPSNSGSTPTRNTRSLINDQSRRHMTLRGLFEFKVDPAKAIADRGGRAGKRDRQALRHRRDVAGLDQHRGAHHAGHRDEPHRRQEQHRRRRRGSGALPQRAEGHPDRRRHKVGGDRRRS